MAKLAITATVRSEGMTLKRFSSHTEQLRITAPVFQLNEKLPEEKAYGMIVKWPYVHDHINSWTAIFIDC